MPNDEQDHQDSTNPFVNDEILRRAPLPPPPLPPRSDVGCHECPLRELQLFSVASQRDQDLIHSLRGHQQHRKSGQTLIVEGQAPSMMFTLYWGWAFRYKTLSDGRRQILNFLLPGDLVGLQQRLSSDSEHGVDALTDVVLCPFPRDSIWTLHRESPQLGYDVTWLCASEESLVDDHLLSVGRRSAEERMAALLLWLYRRAHALTPQIEWGSWLPFPLTQQHIADALGLSLVHTQRTLKLLSKRRGHEIKDGRFRIVNEEDLAKLADVDEQNRLPTRPLL